MFRILVVCTGNICRSPMGEGILRELAAEEGLGNAIEVRSAGTWAVNGSAASRNGIEVAKRHRVDIEDHRSRRLTTELIEAADLLLVMEPTHRIETLALAPKAADKTHVLTLFADPDEGDPAGVEDPIGGDADAYAQTFAEIDSLMLAAFPRIRAMVEARARQTNP